ncbi:MAG: ABC transporter ATP-binding protein [Alphaproteobacteria bacterium]
MQVEGLVHDFGPKRALDGVAFTIEPGDFTVLLGLNGAGKTTLYSLITRLYNNRSGTIRIFGFDVRKQSSKALARIGVVFQQPTLDLDLTVEQNLHYHAALHGIAWGAARTRIEAELKRAELLDRRHDKVRALSGGQRRRVELARALLHRPQLLLLDEPTVGLDIGSRQAIVSHVRRLCREERLAVLWATHLIDEVDGGDRVIVLHEGRILAQGSVPEVVQQAVAAQIRDAFTNLIAKASK